MNARLIDVFKTSSTVKSEGSYIGFEGSGVFCFNGLNDQTKSSIQQNMN